MKKTVISTDKAPGAIGPYSQGICTGEMVFVSGQLPINMETGELEVNDIKEATKNSMNNIKAILAEAGLTMSDIVKTQIFLADLNDFVNMNEVYGSFFEGEYPARSCYQVAGLPKGATIEIEAIAIRR